MLSSRIKLPPAKTSAQRCPYCSGSGISPLYETADQAGNCYLLSKCSRCPSFFLCPPPSEETRRAAYSQTYYGTGHTKFPGMIGYIFDYLRINRARKIARRLEPGVLVLDLGCGNGVFLQALIKKGFKAVGVELPGAAAKRASQVRGLNLHIGS